MANLNFGITSIDPADMLALIERYIGTVTGLGDKAFLSMWPDSFLLISPRASTFVTITPRNFPVWQSIVDGSGFDNPLVGYNTVLTLTCYVQNLSDPETWSTNLIREQVLSLTALTSKIAGAIEGYVPMDSNGNVLVREYMRMPDSGWQFDTVNVKNNIWAKASVQCEMKFSALLPTLPTVTVLAPVTSTTQ